jgi:hypothetical protein
MRKHPSLFLILNASFLVGLTASMLPAQEPHSKPGAAIAGNQATLTVTDSRPLARALDSLQLQYGWLIDYEDPQYISKLDYSEDKGLPGSSTTNPGRKIPAGSSFKVEYPAGSAPSAAPDEQKALQSIVDSYNRSSNPGRFELRHDTDAHFDVVGTAAHDSEGKISRQEVPFDLAISLPAEERSVSETLNLVCQKISGQNSLKVTLGIYPLGLDHVRTTVGAKELSARALVQRAVESSGRKLYWRLLFDPDSNSYVLNIHHAASATARPSEKKP